jgi:hypothetical protein
MLEPEFRNNQPETTTIQQDLYTCLDAVAINWIEVYFMFWYRYLISEHCEYQSYEFWRIINDETPKENKLFYLINCFDNND